MILRQTSLSGNVIQFCRFLRQKGFAAGVDEELLVLQAYRYLDFGNRTIFYEMLKAILCRSKSQTELFEKLYGEYWKELAMALDSNERIKETNSQKKIQKDSFKSLKAWLNGNQNKDIEETATFSPVEKFSEKDFSKISENEIEEIMRCIKLLSKKLAAKLSRRYKPAYETYSPDIRRTLRKNLRRGGELLDIVHKKPKPNRTKLIAICDVSRSMELYTAFLIQFLYATQQAYRRMETFIFSTTIRRITNVLKEKDFSRVKQLLNEDNQGWSDGTRIGESLELFIKKFGHKCIDSKTIVIIVSDGWDTLGIEKLKTSMQYIQSKAKRIIWLNPLAGYEGYKPETMGMHTALPYINIFASVHNLESLKRLTKWL